MYPNHEMLSTPATEGREDYPLLDMVEKRFEPDTGALRDFETAIANRLDAVADLVEAWSVRIARHGYSADEEHDEAYYRAEAVLDRLRRMSRGWWRLHVGDTAEDLLELVPCSGCDGLLRARYARLPRALGRPVLCEGCQKEKTHA